MTKLTSPKWLDDQNALTVKNCVIASIVILLLFYTIYFVIASHCHLIVILY